VADQLIERLRDRLPVNPPYEGLVADGYDAWLPVDEVLDDEGWYTRLVERTDGPVLELGCGTGRPLLRWLAAGHDVEGVDGSTDMLAMLRRHAAERGIDPVVHHGDFAPLALGRTYAAIVCPAGSFTLVDDPDRARAAVASYVEHLRPGGVLALSLFVPPHDDDQALGWRLRRTGTTPAGVTIVVHEAVRNDRDAQVQVAYDRVEAYDAGGRLTETWLRVHHLRWWTNPRPWSCSRPQAWSTWRPAAPTSPGSPPGAARPEPTARRFGSRSQTRGTKHRGTDPRPASRAGGVVEGLAVRARQIQHAEADRGRQSSARSSSQALGPAALRPATTSRSWVWLGLTSTIEVHHCWVRQRPVRQNNVSSRPSALTSPMRPAPA